MGALAAAAASFVLLAIAFVPLERMFPARRDQPVLRPAWAVDACFFLGQYLLWSAASIAVLASVERALAPHAFAGPRSAVAAIPIWARGVLAVIAGDVSVYWFHRACHRFEWLWRFHAVHHSSEHLDWLAAHREHPVDGILTQLFQNLPLLLLGFPVELLAGFAAFRSIWAIYVHSNARLPIGPLRFVLGAPELHHWHHARADRTLHNFANLAPWLDVVFGTYHLPAGEETYPLGLVDPWPRGYVSQLLRPLGLDRLPGAVAGLVKAVPLALVQDVRAGCARFFHRSSG